MENGKRWIRPLGVAGRIALSIATAVVLVAIVLFMTLRLDFQERLMEDAQKHLENILARESEALNEELLRVKRLALALRQLTVNTIEMEALNSEQTLDSQKAMDAFEGRLIPQIKDLIEIFDNVSGWILFNSEVLPGANTISYTYEQGTFIREPEYDAVGEGYAKEPWWSEAVLRGEHWTKPYYWEPWDADIITYSVPIMKDDQLIGVAGAEFFMKPFQERLRGIKVYDTGFVMLIDTEGEAIYLPEEAKADQLSKWYRDKRKALLSEPTGVDYLGDGALIDQSVIAWHRLDNGWLLIAQPKTVEMFATIVRTHQVLTVLLVLTVPIALLLGALMARSLTRRLKALIHAAEHFLENLVPATQAPQTFMTLPEKGEDDLSLLNRAFNRLQRDVQRSLAALSVSEAKYRTLVEYSEHLIFTLNSEGYFLTTNRAMEDMAGRTKEGLMGAHFTAIFESESLRQFWSEKFALVCQQRQRVQTETRILAPDGREHVLLVTLLPILTYSQDFMEAPGRIEAPGRMEAPRRMEAPGKVELVMGTASDLTERLNAEREIQRLLERDKAALSRLVSGIAHEMNTPLGNVMVLLSYLEGAVQQNQDTEEALQSMRRSLQRAIDLINHFKALSANQQKGPRVETNLKTLLTLSLSGNEGFIGGNAVHIDCEDTLVINTYPAALMQVIAALVDNALSHGPVPEQAAGAQAAGTEALAVVVSASLDTAGGQLRIRVCDNGAGMTPSVMEHMYDPFYTTKGGQHHSGLGLSVAYNTIRQVLGGEVTAESMPYPEPGHGTVFTVSLPIA